MSRIGKMPVLIPDGINVKLGKDNTLTVKGKAGTLTKQFHKDMIIKIKDNKVFIQRPSDIKKHKALHGLTRSLINSMVEGLSNGFQKVLEINGVGYRAQKHGKKLVLNVGYSHPIEMEEPEGITVEVPEPGKIIVKGIDKQVVGEFAAKIRDKRKPEVYKGKGIRYENEIVKLKEGKTGA